MTQKFTAEEVRAEAAEISDYGGTQAGLMLTAYADTLSKPADSGRVGDVSSRLRGLIAEIDPPKRPATDLNIKLIAGELRSIAALAAQGQGDSYAPLSIPDDAPDSYAEAYIRDWCPDHVKAYIARKTAPPAPPAGVPDVVSEVLAELEKAIRKFPTWPTDPLHAVGVFNEEAGELSKAVLQQVYEPHKNAADDVRKEARQAAAMALRFLVSIDSYDWTPGTQHEQPSLAAPSQPEDADHGV